MTQRDDLDRMLTAWLDDPYTPPAPPYLGEVLERTRRTRQRRAWASLERWLPMADKILARPASPPLRLARLLLIALLVWPSPPAAPSWARGSSHAEPTIPQGGAAVFAFASIVGDRVRPRRWRHLHRPGRRHGPAPADQRAGEIDRLPRCRRTARASPSARSRTARGRLDRGHGRGRREPDDRWRRHTPSESRTASARRPGVVAGRDEPASSRPARVVRRARSTCTSCRPTVRRRRRAPGPARTGRVASWSPDGTRIAFLGPRPAASTGVYVADVGASDRCRPAGSGRRLGPGRLGDLARS